MTDRTMRPIRETIPLEEARALILDAARPVTRVESVPLEQAHQRVLARDIVAAADVPPFSRAAMDGFAVIAADTFGAGQFAPKSLRLVEKVYTGQVPAEEVPRGGCTEIATGAPMPVGADAVVMVEDTEKGDDSRVHVFSPVYPGQNVGRQGADIRAGQPLLAVGDYLTSGRIGAIAALGFDHVDVFARPRVAILSTGNEIVAPGQPLAPGQIYDINRFTLSAVVSEHGGVPVAHPTPADTIDDLNRALDGVRGEDLVIFSGGSSVGERDLILDAIATRGEIVFHGIAVKPGKPTLFGVIDATPVLGMPGYPTSCLSNSYMLVVPLLRRLARLPEAVRHIVSLPAGQRIVSTTGRHQFYTVRIVGGTAMPAFKASGDITSMSQADGYIEIPAQTDIVEKGELVDVILF
jgi:molybdenum cofactor synthesis domain-containing protein